MEHSTSHETIELARLLTTTSADVLSREPDLSADEIERAMEAGRKLRDKAESAVVPNVRNLSQMFFK